MAVLDAKLPAWQGTTKALSVTKAEAKTLEGKAPLVIDGGGLGSGVRVLLKDQTKAEQNGLYEVTTNEAFAGTGNFAGAGSFAKGEGWTLTRTADADSSGEVTEGMLVPIEDGDTNQATSWIQRTPGPIEVGVTAQTFEALVAGARGNAGGELEGLYSKPSIAEAVIDNNNVKAEAGIGASKLDLKAAVAATDLAASSKELFLRAVNGTNKRVDFGEAVVKFSASEFATATVKHGLEATPAFAAPIEMLSGGSYLLASFIESGGLSKTQITFRFRAAAVFTGEINFLWAAIG